jgi:hypothetical protein
MRTQRGNANFDPRITFDPPALNELGSNIVRTTGRLYRAETSPVGRFLHPRMQPPRSFRPLPDRFRPAPFRRVHFVDSKRAPQ